MSLQAFSMNLGGSGGSSTVGGKYVRSTRFVIISAGTSGTVTLPPSSTVVLDDFGGTVDAIVTKVSGGKPTLLNALSALGAVVSTTFDASGNYTFSAAPSAYDVAIVYRVKQTLDNFDDTATDLMGLAQIEDAQVKTFGITLDGGGQAITTGVKGYVTIPYACTIQGWTLTADISGSIVIDVWKVAYASFPPTVSNPIAGSEKPTITSSNKGQDLSLSTWTLADSAGDVIGFNVDSCTTITKATLVIQAVK